MWDKETLIVPIIKGALGSIPNDLECNLKKLGISYNVGTLEKSLENFRTALSKIYFLKLLPQQMHFKIAIIKIFLLVLL